MEYEYAVDIAAPVERVWPVLVDLAAWPEWTQSVTAVERLDPELLAVGSRTRLHQPGMRPMVWTVTALEPHRRFTWKAASAGITISADHVLTPNGQVVNAVLSVGVTGGLAPVLTPLFGGRIRRYVRMEADGLKTQCEAPVGA